MMRIGLLGILAIIFSSAANAQSVAQSVTAGALRSSEKWRVEYRSNDCVLSRSFGSGAEQISLTFVRKLTLEQFDGVISGPGVTVPKGRVTLVLRLLPGSAETKMIGYGVQRPNSTERQILFENADAAILKSINDSQVLEIATGKKERFALLLTSAKSAIGSFDKCHSDLLTSWGLDPAAVKSAKSAPKPAVRPETWVTGNDYPREAHSLGITGRVDFAIIVDASGKPSGCKIVRSSQSALLDSTTCRLLLQRSKFTPARDLDGKPIAGLYFDQVNWIIPRD